ncbi:hypothetical protein [Mucilaginibacter flavidus]|uniref:hypothetical protein n=1 Tax=Mucilaginibacter flavidus TaxID=2949309 RepID=UPI002092B462|nr:hypothetical protein [Mucilaginibacter flavidus]MCO5946273.1 hypothetical protein [Mucilaginibacter flavidus]
MNSSFLAYIQKLEAMAFFSGYALVYTVILFILGNRRLKGKLSDRVISFLPASYALISILFLGFQLKKLYPDYSFEHIQFTIQQPFLVIWGLLPIAFLAPFFYKRPVLSLLHSCLFFYFVVSDLFFLAITPSADNNIVKNDMRVLAASIILNLALPGLITILFLAFSYLKKRKPLFVKKLGSSGIILGLFNSKNHK